MFDSFFTDSFNGHDVMDDRWETCQGEGYSGYRPELYGYFYGKIKKETTKAVLVEIVGFEERGHKFEFLGESWLPKSRINFSEPVTNNRFKNLGKVSVIQTPEWLIEKKKNMFSPRKILTEKFAEYEELS